MSIRRVYLLGGGALLAVAGLVAFVDPVKLMAYGEPEIVAGEPEIAARGQELCGAQSTVEQLKRVVFTRAIENADRGDEALTLLEADSVARMEEPVLVRYDQQLDRAECEGRLVIELPRGIEALFDDQRRLRERVEYSAQPAADDSGLVYTIAQAGDTIDALAAADLERVEMRRERPERYAERAPPKPTFAETAYGPPPYYPDDDWKPSDRPRWREYEPRVYPPPMIDPKDWPIY